MSNTARLAPLVLVAASLAACGKSESSAASGSAPAQAAPQAAAAPAEGAPLDPAAASAAADKVFTGQCAVCHGATGHGDGAGASALSAKPANFSDAAWQSATTDEQIRNAILQGGLGVGKNAAMPATPALGKQPEVLAALIAKLRAFGKPAP